MWGSSTSVVIQKIQREMKEFEMIEIRCDRCKQICEQIKATEIEPKMVYFGEPELYHLCDTCMKAFKQWCKQGVEE